VAIPSLRVVGIVQTLADNLDPKTGYPYLGALGGYWFKENLRNLEETTVGHLRALNINPSGLYV
jgi:hypothetical protein